MKRISLGVGMLVLGLAHSPAFFPHLTSTDIGSALAAEKNPKKWTSSELRKKIQEIDERIKTSPSGQLYAAKANAYVMLHEPQKALPVINKAIALQPQESDLLAYRGLIYLKLGDNDNAIGNIKKAHSMGFQNSNSLSTLAHAQYLKRDLNNALSNAVKSLKMNSHNYTALYIKGCVENTKENYLEASKTLTLAIQARSDISDFYSERAVAFEKLGKHQDALKDLAHSKKLEQITWE